MRVSSEPLLNFGHPRKKVQNLSSLEISLSLHENGLRCSCRCRRCCFSRRPWLPVSTRQRFPDACLKVQPSFSHCSNLVSLALDFTTASFEDSRHISLRLVSGRCKIFAHRSALSPSVIMKSSCDIEVSFLDRMVEFRRCTEIFNVAHERHRIEILQIPKQFGFPMHAVVSEKSTNDLGSSCFVWVSGDILRTRSGLHWLASPEFGPHNFETAP